MKHGPAHDAQMIEAWFAGLITGVLSIAYAGKVEGWTWAGMFIALISFQILYWSDGHAGALWLGGVGLAIAAAIGLWRVRRGASPP